MSSVSEPTSTAAAQREPILICYDDSPDAVRAIEAAACPARPAPRGQLARPTSKGLVDVADELDVAVIVIGSRGLTGMKEGFRPEPLVAGRRARRPAGADRAAGALTANDARGRPAARRTVTHAGPTRHERPSAGPFSAYTSDRTCRFPARFAREASIRA
jgi:hypothetical protein